MAVRTLPPDEIGAANGFMFGSQYAGIALGGSGALLVSGWAGFHGALLFILASLALVLFGVTIPLLEPASGMLVAGDSFLKSLLERLRTFFIELREGVFGSGRGPLVGALFAVFPGGAMALSLAVGTTMQVDLKLSESVIAAIAFLSNAAGGLGALAGGWISDRFGNPRACIAASYVLTGVTTLFLSAQWGGIGATGFAVFVIAYFGFFGFQYGAASGMYMRLSNPAVAATQFTAFMALRNLPFSYSSAWQGAYVDAHGYATTLRLDAALACAGLVVLYWVTPYRTRSAKPAAAPAMVME